MKRGGDARGSDTRFARVDVAGLACNTITIPELGKVVAEHLAGPTGATLSILCANAHIHDLAHRDERLRGDLGAASLVALDGMSLVWAIRLVHGQQVDRCNMTEAFRSFLQSPSSSRTDALVIGLEPADARRAAAAINELGGRCHVTRVLGGYEDVSTYVDALEDDPVPLVLVGCGTPRSERVVTSLAATGRAAVVWHVGGGTLRFLAGDDREAPAWMRRTGLQWLHRLFRHPRDLARRYLVGLPRFAWRVLRHGRRSARTAR